MLRRMPELEADALAMPAGRKAPALYHRHLVRHVGVRRIVGDGVDAGLRHDLARPVFLRHDDPFQNRANFSTIWETPLNLSAFQFAGTRSFDNCDADRDVQREWD